MTADMLSDRPRIAGALVGLLLGAASWAGNAERTTLGIAAAFPDVLTVAVVPISLYFFVRARLSASNPPDLRALRRAGWAVVNTAALVAALFLASVTAFWFHQVDEALIAMTLVSVIVVTVGVGYVSVEVWARMRPGASGGHR
jgi:hypothetical protein